MVSLEEAKQQLDILELQIESAKTSYSDIRKIEMSIMRIGDSLAKLTGSRDVQNAINQLNRIIGTVRTLQMAMHALQIASGPIGWLYAGATVLGAGVIIGEQIYQDMVGT